jgi:hypothetical protein
MSVDKFWDMGGSYILNPVTGERELVERTQAAEDVVLPNPDPTVIETTVEE